MFFVVSLLILYITNNRCSTRHRYKLVKLYLEYNLVSVFLFSISVLYSMVQIARLCNLSSLSVLYFVAESITKSTVIMRHNHDFIDQ